MTDSELYHAGWTAALVNHLWQSTVVVGVAWLVARKESVDAIVIDHAEQPSPN